MAERHKRSEMLRDLIYALSHDLRTPLTAARMTMLQALEGAYGELPVQYGEILRRAIEPNEELYRLAETLLLVARYESGEQSFFREPVDMAALATTVTDELQPLIQSKHIEMRRKVPGEPVYVLGDGGELRRAVTNLLANAVTWTPRHGIISVILTPDAGAATMIIEDNGYGVPANVRANLFQRFSGRARQGGGSGLGLYIVYRITEGHGGSITYSPVASGGSVFTLRLPRAPEAALHG